VKKIDENNQGKEKLKEESIKAKGGHYRFNGKKKDKGNNKEKIQG